MKCNNSSKIYLSYWYLVLKELEDPKLPFDILFTYICVVIATQNANLWMARKHYEDSNDSDQESKLADITDKFGWETTDCGDE